MFCLKLFLSVLVVSTNPGVLENEQEKGNITAHMLYKMEAMQNTIYMLEKSDREMKQTLADVRAKFHFLAWPKPSQRSVCYRNLNLKKNENHTMTFLVLYLEVLSFLSDTV